LILGVRDPQAIQKRGLALVMIPSWGCRTLGLSASLRERPPDGKQGDAVNGKARWFPFVLYLFSYAAVYRGVRGHAREF
jgi:hypothetical protein